MVKHDISVLDINKVQGIRTWVYYYDSPISHNIVNIVCPFKGDKQDGEICHSLFPSLKLRPQSKQSLWCKFWCPCVVFELSYVYKRALLFLEEWKAKKGEDHEGR